MHITFSFQMVTSLLKRKQLKSFIESIFASERVPAASLSVVFCDNEYLLTINRDFLQHDFYTDIITFDLTEPGSTGLSGEIYISVDMVKSNAKTFNSRYQHELHRVIFHGVLHLCGYMDKSKPQKKLMTQKEDFYLKGYFSN